MNFEFTVEQEFNLKMYEIEIKKLSKEELSGLLINATRLLIIRDNLIQSLIREKVMGEIKRREQ